MSESEPIVLRSAANATIRHLTRMRDNRARRKAERVIVDGWRETTQAIEAGLDLCGLYLTESLASSPTEGSIGRLLSDPATRSRVSLVSDSIMQKISYGQSSRGVVAEFIRPSRDLSRLQLPEFPFLLVLDRIEKPGNIGAVFRCADAAGVHAVLLCDSQDLFNPNAIRSSLGSVFHVPSASGTQSQIAEFLLANGCRVMAARVESSTSLWSASWDGAVAVVLGSEAQGLGGRWRSIGDQAVEGVQIPMAGKVDSLNISVSAAVIAFEAMRRRPTTVGTA